MDKVEISQSVHNPQNKRFRLPAAVYLSRTHFPQHDYPEDRPTSAVTPSGFVPLAIGSLAQSLATLAPSPEGSGQRMLLDNLQHWLGRPTIALDGELPITTDDVTFALHILLSTLNPAVGARHAVVSTVQCEAVGLTPLELQTAWQQLDGVGVACPGDWGGDQRQAIAQAILDTQLVASASQIDFVDAAIAALLSVLPGPTSPLLLPEPSSRPSLCNQSWTGNVLVVARGSSMLHLAVIALPSNLQTLQRQHCILETLPMVDRLQLIVEQLHQALMTLLQTANLSPVEIHHVLYADDVDPSPAIAQWLKKQIPNATHVWDSDRAANRESSRLAFGAAVQALYAL
ncbi:MAG: hypothetical protein IGR76_02795 [Synechococcales cyanobacterium T60_A2020_003]|nr:hypothetical protein [Synechococcales cyanobacterium T60_A2020_003]